MAKHRTDPVGFLPTDCKPQRARKAVELDPSRDRLMRRPEVERVTGKSRSAIYREMAAGSFPRKVRIGPNSVAWLASEIDRYVALRVASSRKAA